MPITEPRAQPPNPHRATPQRFGLKTVHRAVPPRALTMGLLPANKNVGQETKAKKLFNPIKQRRALLEIPIQGGTGAQHTQETWSMTTGYPASWEPPALTNTQIRTWAVHNNHHTSPDPPGLNWANLIPLPICLAVQWRHVHGCLAVDQGWCIGGRGVPCSLHSGWYINVQRVSILACAYCAWLVPP